MTVMKTANGRWRAQLKSGREHVASKTFDSKKEAQDWIDRERAALRGGIDPRAGKRRVRDLVTEWLAERKRTVSRNAYITDQAMEKALPTFLKALSIGAVTDREVTRALIAMHGDRLSEGTVRRYRSSLSSFFAWAVRERLIAANPVTPTRVPKDHVAPVEMRPFSEAELEQFHAAAAKHDKRLADLFLVAGWTGLRWGELREMRVRDFVEVPMAMLRVQRSTSEGGEAKAPKSGKSRQVPLADHVLTIVRGLAEGRGPDDLLFRTSRGSRLHASAVKRAVHWKQIANGRRIHDLRHTAACLWLSKGVDPSLAQAWLGHSSIAVTNRYLHHLGTLADQAGLALLNGAGRVGGAQLDESAKQIGP